MKKVEDIIHVMESIAPTYLKEDYDNVGLMVGDRDKTVKKVLLALDCTLDVVKEAKEKDVDLIITHHPLIFRKPSSITTDTLQGKKIIELIKSDISLFSSHTNLDSVEDGLNSTITKLLGFNDFEILDVSKKNDKAGLGRIAAFEEAKTLEEVVDLIKATFNIKSLRVVKGKDSIKKVAIINGSGQEYIQRAIAKGADCIITGDTTYHFASDYKEMNVNIIDMGHFGSEWIVFLKVMEKAKEQLSEIEFIQSEVVEDPYTFL